MARRKTDTATEQPQAAPVAAEALPPKADADPVSDTNGNVKEELVTTPVPPLQNCGKRKPDQTFKVWSDRTTVLEVAIWESEVKYDVKVTVQHHVQISRAHVNGDGKFVPS